MQGFYILGVRCPRNNYMLLFINLHEVKCNLKEMQIYVNLAKTFTETEMKFVNESSGG